MCRRVTDTIALKKLMVEKGLDRITDLANASGVSRTTLSNVLRGKSQPSAGVMEKLIATLHIPLAQTSDIFFGER